MNVLHLFFHESLVDSVCFFYVFFVLMLLFFFFVFFFQPEDGIRDWSVTGVQTCALPISAPLRRSRASEGRERAMPPALRGDGETRHRNMRTRLAPPGARPCSCPIWEGIPPGEAKIGRASCRERG